MPTLLFNLTNVPTDEADEVRQLLEEGGFDFYETDAGRWKSGVAAIWLADPKQTEAANRALTEYQAARREKARVTYEQLKDRGELPGWQQKWSDDPVGFGIKLVTVALAVTAILALMTVPFLGYLT